MNYRISLLIASLVVMVGCGSQLTRKELTPEEKAKITREIESTQVSIVNPFIGIALSACQYHKTFKKWPAADFVSTQQSNFDSFKIIPEDSVFHSEFKLKSSDYIFRIKIGMPNSQFDIKTSTNHTSKRQREIAEAKKKLQEKIVEIRKKEGQVRKVVEQKDPDCKFVLTVAPPKKSAIAKMKGPIILGETWTSDAERKMLSRNFLIFSKLSDSLPPEKNSNIVEKLFISGLGEAFVKASLCLVLGMNAGNCH